MVFHVDMPALSASVIVTTTRHGAAGTPPSDVASCSVRGSYAGADAVVSLALAPTESDIKRYIILPRSLLSSGHGNGNGNGNVGNGNGNGNTGNGNGNGNVGDTNGNLNNTDGNGNNQAGSGRGNGK